MMSDRDETPVRCRFGEFELNTRTLELSRRGEPVPLEPLPARILCRLVENAGEMVGREELLELGWPRLPQVADQSLNTCIRQIRDALDDDASDPTWVETLRGRGYRFRGAVEWLDGPRGRRAGFGWKVAGGAGLLLAAGVLAVAWSGGSDQVAPLDPELRVELAKAEHLVSRSLDLPGALEILDGLAEEHPGVGAVHAERAEVLALLDRREEAWDEVATALTLDEGLATAHRTLGLLRMTKGDWAGAETAVRRAVALEPEGVRSLNALAFLQTVTGRFDQARASLDRTVELDPLSPLIQGDAGFMHLWARRYEEAVDACRETLRLRPEATWALGCVYDALVLAGRTEEAAEWGRRMLEEEGAGGAIPLGAGPDDVLDAIGTWRVRTWERAVAEEGSRPYGLAVAYAGRGRVEEGLEALRTAVEGRHVNVLTLAVDPRLDPLRGDPAYRKLVGELGLGS